ncbi:hypothetical protein [Pyxidicoccus caerfyrddinensis]|nr:hypothetical protein [Pyxidicoccus caerfyrddinensis]
MLSRQEWFYVPGAMTITALKPFIPSGKDFAAARSFFVDLNDGA